MKSCKRSERRAKIESIKAKREKYWGGDKLSKRDLGRACSAPKNIAGCACCCKTRKHHGETLQEKKHGLENQEF